MANPDINDSSSMRHPQRCRQSPSTRVRATAGPLATILGLLLLTTPAVASGPAASGSVAAVSSLLPGPVTGWSSTIGTDGRAYIADSSGRALQFHGFNHKTENPDSITDELLAAASERGMDHLRLSIYWDALEPTEGTFDEAYLDRVVAALDRARAHGILVIIDMHQDVFGPAFGSRGIPAWATRTDGEAFVPQPIWLLNYLQAAVQNAFEHLYEDADLRTFQVRAWIHVVQRVRDHPAVLGYDLMNEPFGKLRAGEDLVTAAARVEREQLTPMYQRLTDAIGSIDGGHWVFIEPTNVASLGIPTALGEVHGSKVALYPHMYDAAIESATYTPGGVVQYDPAFFDRWAGAITTYTAKYAVPMLVGEWGVAHPDVQGMDLFIRDGLATLDRSTSGWSVFNWCKGDGYCPLDADGNDRPGISQIFEPYARAVAGAPTSSTWDPPSATLEVRFSDNPATGATEIFIPESRAYPSGWKVETSDPAAATTSFDPATGVLSVTIADTGAAHAICVKPTGAAAGCAAATSSTTSPSPSSTTSTAGSNSNVAQAIAASPRFTG